MKGGTPRSREKDEKKLKAPSRTGLNRPKIQGWERGHSSRIPEDCGEHAVF